MVCSQHKPKNKTKTKTKKSKKKNKRNRKKERKKGCKKVQSGYSQLKLKSHCCLFFLVHLFHFILFIYVFCSFGFLSNTCLDVHKANNNETLYVHIVTNITQRKINIAVNCLSIGGAILYSKEQTKKATVKLHFNKSFLVYTTQLHRHKANNVLNKSINTTQYQNTALVMPPGKSLSW